MGRTAIRKEAAEVIRNALLKNLDELEPLSTEQLLENGSGDSRASDSSRKRDLHAEICGNISRSSKSRQADPLDT